MAGWVNERRAGLAGDRLFLLSHPPVITYGSRTAPATSRRPGGYAGPPVDRGGYATYHGPGQLVGYLVIDMARGGPVDMCGGWSTAWSVRWRAGFAALPAGTPRRGPPAWSGSGPPNDHKVASIGMRIRHGVTSHGFALNVNPDMRAFGTFTVCGLPGVRMISLRAWPPGGVSPRPATRPSATRCSGP